jgi:pimeloyl-ACP methyl ester carboxylesterase
VRIPGARLEVFTNAGHGVFRDKAAEALQVIREFVLAPASTEARDTEL